jgi:hypothetical protein
MAPHGFPPATPVYRGRSAISTGWRLIFGAPAPCAVGLLYNAFRDGACPRFRTAKVGPHRLRPPARELPES